MNEIYKDIKGYEGLYQVSNMGNVRRINGTKIYYKQPYMSNHGYLCVALYKDGERKNYYIHRLVANVFLENPNNLPSVTHKNYIRTDNRLENLEYIDIKGLRKSQCKPILGYNKNTALLFPSIKDVQIVHFSPDNVSMCLNKKSNTAHTFKWQFLTDEQFNKLKDKPNILKYGDIR